MIDEDVEPTGLHPLVYSSIEVGRRRAPGLHQRGVEIVVEKVQPQTSAGCVISGIATRSAETASTVYRPGCYASARMRPTGSFLKCATSAGTKLVTRPSGPTMSENRRVQSPSSCRSSLLSDRHKPGYTSNCTCHARVTRPLSISVI